MIAADRSCYHLFVDDDNDGRVDEDCSSVVTLPPTPPPTQPPTTPPVTTTTTQPTTTTTAPPIEPVEKGMVVVSCLLIYSDWVRSLKIYKNDNKKRITG